jgi:hypothetical protein
MVKEGKAEAKAKVGMADRSKHKSNKQREEQVDEMT